MFNLGGWEWIIVLIIILLLFGPGRIGKLSGELGKSIKAFRDGLGSEQKSEQKDEDKPTDPNINIEPK